MNLLVNIDVDDLGKATAFYCQAFGLQVGRRLGEDVTELLGASSSIYLLAKPEGSRPSDFTAQKRIYRRHWCPIHLDFVVSDVEASLQRAVAAGAKVEQAVQSFNWGKLALMSDPFGHGFCLIEFVGKGYDEIASG
jgi:predicted enzyme related to lactoylglutathione lyase